MRATERDRSHRIDLAFEEKIRTIRECHYHAVRPGHLAGFDAGQAAGIFTQGTTFCNLYGYLMGSRGSLCRVRGAQRGLSHP